MLTYPATLTPDEEDGGFVVTFRDVPEAITQGRYSRGGAAQRRGRFDRGAGVLCRGQAGQFPGPSKARLDEHLITLPALVAAKLELYRRMCETGTTRVALAQMLGVDERAVRRLLAYKHRSHIGQIEAALAKLGKRLEISVRDAA